MVHQNKNIKTKKYKKQLTTLLYTQCIQYTCNTQIMTPLESKYKQCVGRQSVGAPKQRCSNVAYVRSQVRRPHKHIFVSQTIYQQFTLLYFTTSLTIYFTLLHSLKTRLFINPVLNNPKPKPNPNPNPIREPSL